MDRAGYHIAKAVESFCEKRKLPKVVTLLAGKGNKGGDGYTTAINLLQMGFSVKAYQLFPLESCSELCKERCSNFQSKGGSVSFSTDNLKLEGVILDGLVGTGFHGPTKGVLVDVIKKANDSKLPILAIDIPSCLDDDSGTADVAIVATQTIYLGMPKIGFFLEQGPDHTGELVFGDLEISNTDLNQEAHLLCHSDMKGELPHIKPTRHKYEAGYVLAIAGSSGMTGAAALSTKAVLRSGAGMVRLFHPYGLEDELVSCSNEVVKEGWDGTDMERLCEEAKRAKCILVGPGLGRTKQVQKLLRKVFVELHLPMVIDADALYFLANDLGSRLPKGSILTPHKQEMARFFAKKYAGYDFFAACRDFAKKEGDRFSCKRSRTFVFSHDHVPVCIQKGDPGMATAGAGDVLTGIIAGLVAQGLTPYRAAVLGVYLHSLAGKAAAKDKTSYCMIASDIIEHLPEAFKALLDDNRS